MDRFLVPLFLAGLALALLLYLLHPSLPPSSPPLPILIEGVSASVAVAMSAAPSSLAADAATGLSVSISDAAGVWSARLERPAALFDPASKCSLSVCVEHAAGLCGGLLSASPAATWVTDGTGLVLAEHASGTFASPLRVPSAALAEVTSGVLGQVLIEHRAGTLGEATYLPDSADPAAQAKASEP